MTAPLLEIKNLKKYYPVKKTRSGEKTVVKAVDDINLTVNQGEIIGLVGESGCGKSTLGKTILKLHSVTDGQILFHGEDITSYNENQMRPLREKMQIIFQDPYASLNPKKRVAQAVMAPLNVSGKYSQKEKEEKVEAIMQEVGLGEKFLDKYPHEMSGGQRQRVVIARALINDPELVICDEPVSALDVSVRSQVLNLLKDLQKGRNLTYLFISHDLSVVKHISNRIGVIYLGQFMEVADTQTLFDNPLHPYTQSLLSAIPIPDPTVKLNRVLLEGDIPSPSNAPSGCKFRTRCPRACGRCAEEVPALREVETGHQVACHRVGE